MARQYEDFFKKFESYNRSTTGTVIIHPGLSYNLIELTEDFVQELKKDLMTKVNLASVGIDELDASTKFAIMMLDDSY